jgi:hypothetical protein
MPSFTSPYTLPPNTNGAEEVYQSKEVPIYRGGYMQIGSASNRFIAEAFANAPALRTALAAAVADLEGLLELLPGGADTTKIELDAYRELLKQTPAVY